MIRGTVLVLFAVCALADQRVSVASRVDSNSRLRNGWTRDTKLATDASDPVTFTVYLKQTGLDKLDAHFNAVSDPKAKEYGHFLTKQELDVIVKAEPEAFAAVRDWLGNYQVKATETSDSVVISTTANVASSIFSCAFHKYHQQRTGRTRTLAFGHVSVPAVVSKYIDFIGGLTELWHGKAPARTADRKRRSVGDDKDIVVTPSVLRAYYNISANESNVATNNIQGIAAFSDYYSPDALAQFNSEYGLPTPKVTVEGVDCLGDKKPCDQVESDLDMQYITAMGAGVDTVFFNQNDGWVLDFSENTQSMSPLPLVVSVSYGWAELKQCAVDYRKCDTLGYDSAQYVARTNTGFQKLATMGVSILVSDGDDGATGVEPDGANPVDRNRWCGGSPYACYPRTYSKCAEIQLTNTSLPGSRCPWPVGLHGLDNMCDFLYQGDFYQADVIFKALNTTNPACNLEIYYDTDLGIHLYSECECSALAPLSHGAVVSELYAFNASERIFWGDFPTGSPYVTSVGATIFKTSDGTTIIDEVGASIVNGAIITTGGGFSSLADQPAWQSSAVKTWAATGNQSPPAGSFDVTKRAYPDITLSGHNYQVVYTEDGKEQCPCKLGGVDGTSASSPALAGIISLINGHLLAQGSSPLGFLNPLLYQMSVEAPHAFRDITLGDNKCTRNFCFQYGYSAEEGWDPVAGLGSINYGAMKDYILSMKR